MTPIANHPDRIEQPFGKWLWREATFLVSLALTFASLYMTIAREWSVLERTVKFLGQHLDTVVFAIQCTVILLFLLKIVFGKPPLACPHEGERRRSINRAVERFHATWCWVWGSWAVFYAALAFKKYAGVAPAELHLDASIDPGRPLALIRADSLVHRILHSAQAAVDSGGAAGLRETVPARYLSPDSLFSWRMEYHAGRVAPSALPPHIADVVLNALNNINGLAFLMLYLILIRQPTRPLELHRPSAQVFFVPAIAILAIAELASPPGALAAFNWYSLIASVLAAIVLILFFGRLGGQYIRPPVAVSVMLAAYCALQLAWPYFSEKNVAALVASGALLLKVVLFFIVDYALHSGDLIYYIDRVMDRGTIMPNESGPIGGLPTLGAVQKQRQIKLLLSDRKLEPWGTDDVAGGRSGDVAGPVQALRGE